MISYMTLDIQAHALGRCVPTCKSDEIEGKKQFLISLQ